jgi:cation transport regulator ChaC
MDNRRTLRGYKYYVDVATGRRPPVFVAFLDLAPHDREAVNGVVFEVPDAHLTALDRRERNYHRRDVADHLDLDLGGAPVWAYLGRDEARDRHRRALATGTGVVSREYVDGVRRGFGAFGEDMVRDFDRTTATPQLPIRELRCVNVP